MNYQPRFLILLSLTMMTFSTTSFLLTNKTWAQTSEATVKSNKANKTQAQHQNTQNKNDDQSDDNQDKDQDPTSALFNAINVGSLDQAQKALNRGADLYAKNVLGQTPLEMSSDLNRDRITFLLLSMRGYNNSPSSLSNGPSEASNIVVKNGKGHLSIEGRHNRKDTASSLQKSKTYSQNIYEQPKPDIGFLGFSK